MVVAEATQGWLELLLLCYKTFALDVLRIYVQHLSTPHQQVILPLHHQVHQKHWPGAHGGLTSPHGLLPIVMSQPRGWVRLHLAALYVIKISLADHQHKSFCALCPHSF
jgi:hypothetical protein